MVTFYFLFPNFIQNFWKSFEIVQDCKKFVQKLSEILQTQKEILWCSSDPQTRDEKFIMLRISHEHIASSIAGIG